MTTQLTERDKRLIYLLVLVIIVFAFLELMIFPQLNRGADLDSTINSLQEEKMTMQVGVLSADSAKQNYNNSLAAYSAVVNTFYPYMQNYEIDRMFTSLMVDGYSMKVVSLKMSDTPAGKAVSSYLQASSSGSKSSSSSSSATDYPLLTSMVTLTAQGTRDNAMRLLDALFTAYPSLRVTKYSIQSGTASASYYSSQTTGVSGLADGDVQLSLTFDLYMQAAE